jgi:hypothetical protein
MSSSRDSSPKNSSAMKFAPSSNKTGLGSETESYRDVLETRGSKSS